jgi:hypothetical protein
MHDTQNFDVWYSVASNTGPWTIIALDLPPGDLAVGSLHTHSWLVPSINDASAWIRIRQDNNVDADYEDVSDGSFSIATVIGLAGDFNNDGTVDAADYVVWRKNPGGIYAQADFNTWRANFGETIGNGSAVNIAVPEPASILLLMSAAVAGFIRRRTFRRVSQLVGV